jgi:hypothetical protein
MAKASSILILIFLLLFLGYSKEESDIVELSQYCVDIYDTKAERVTRYCASEDTGDVQIQNLRKKTIVSMFNARSEVILIPLKK